MSSSDRIIRAAGPGCATGVVPAGRTPAAAPGPVPARPAGHVLVGRAIRRGVSAVVAPAAAPQPGASEALPGALEPPDIEAELAAARARGHAEGEALARRELEDRVEAVAAFAAQLEAAAPHEAAVIARVVVDLSLAIAARILDREVDADPALLAGVIDRVLRTVNGSPEAHVFLNPATVDAVREAWEATHGASYLGKRWMFEPDPSLPAGGCIIRHEHGFVDVGLETQLEEVRLVLDRTIPVFARARAAQEGEGAA